MYSFLWALNVDAPVTMATRAAPPRPLLLFATSTVETEAWRAKWEWRPPFFGWRAWSGIPPRRCRLLLLETDTCSLGRDSAGVGSVPLGKQAEKHTTVTKHDLNGMKCKSDWVTVQGDVQAVSFLHHHWVSLFLLSFLFFLVKLVSLLCIHCFQFSDNWSLMNVFCCCQSRPSQSLISFHVKDQSLAVASKQIPIMTSGQCGGHGCFKRAVGHLRPPSRHSLSLPAEPSWAPGCGGRCVCSCAGAPPC